MRNIRFIAPTLVVALSAALFAVAVSQREEAAVVAESSLTIAFSADSTTTLVDLPLPTNPPATTTTAVTPPLSTSSTTVAAKKSPPTTAKKTPSPTTTAPKQTTTTIQAGYNSNYESQFFAKISGLRSSSGLPSLTRGAPLDAEARSWAKSIATLEKLAHSNISRLTPPWEAAAENLGAGSSVNAVFALLSGSGSHLDIMLGNFSHVGVGVWVDSSGKLWTVHIFVR